MRRWEQTQNHQPRQSSFQLLPCRPWQQQVWLEHQYAEKGGRLPVWEGRQPWSLPHGSVYSLQGEYHQYGMFLRSCLFLLFYFRFTRITRSTRYTRSTSFTSLWLGLRSWEIHSMDSFRRTCLHTLLTQTALVEVNV